MPFVSFSELAPDRLEGPGDYYAPHPDAPKEQTTWPAGYETGESEPSLLGATFRQENIIGSAIGSEAWRTPNEIDPNFSAFDFTKARGREDIWGRLKNSFNEAHASAVVRDAEREAEDRRTRDRSPLMSTLAGFGATLLDPTIALPAGALVKGARGGYSVARSALSLGAAAGVQTTAQEAGLQATQQLRTPEESVTNIGGSVVLGSLLGAAGSRLFTPHEWGAASAAIDRNMVDAATAQERLGEFVGGAQEGVSAGAMATPPPTLADYEIYGRAARAVGKAAAPLIPVLRLMGSPSAVLRDISARLLEQPYYLSKNAQGLGTGVAVETGVVRQNGRWGRGQEAANAIYSDARKSGLQMTEEEFGSVIGRMMSEGDRANVDDALLWKPMPQRKGESDAAYLARRQAVAPVLDRAAEKWRSILFDPIKDDAIATKRLPADVEPDNATSYFSTVWDRGKVEGQEAAFKRDVSSHFAGVIGDEFEQARGGLTKRLADMEGEVADLRLSPEDRTTALADIEERLGGLDILHPEQSARADAIDRQRQIIRDARAKVEEMKGESQGKRMLAEKAAADAEKVAREKIAALQGEGGADLKAFQETRSGLRTRRQRVDLSYAGLSERSDRILGQLADLEEANQRTMGRMVGKGQKLERDLGRLDPEMLQGRIDDLRNSLDDIAERGRKAAERAEAGIKRLDEAAQRSWERSNKAATAEERAAHLAEAQGADVAAKQRLAQEVERQRARAEQMDKLSARLSKATAFDREAAVAEVRAGIERAVAEASNVSLARGERAQRMKERLATLGPERVDERIKALEARKKELTRKFYDTWEIKHLGEGVDLAGTARPDFTEMGNGIAESVFNKITGRGGEMMIPGDRIVVNVRGPMKERTLNIPPRKMWDYMDTNVSRVGRRYARIMGADIELSRQFGDPTMKAQLEQITQDYAKLRAAAAGDAKRIKMLDAREKADKRDLLALVTQIRGMNMVEHASSDFDKIVRVSNQLNYLRLMGGMTIGNLPDLIRPIMVHGFKSLGFGPLARILSDDVKKEAIQASIKDIKLAGNALEAVSNSRLAAQIDVDNPFREQTGLESFMHKMTDTMSKYNGIRWFNDTVKQWAGVVTQNRIIEGIRNYEKISAKERAYLAYLGLDARNVELVAPHIARHSEEIRGVNVAHTDDWAGDTAEAARHAYYGAVNKDVNSITSQPGVGDVPLFARTPLGRMTLQFKAFNIAANQRIIMRGLQEDQARFWAGIVGATTIGMMIDYFRAIEGNKLDKFSDNPMTIVVNGFDRGIPTLPFEISNTAEKLGLYGIKRATTDLGTILFPGVSGQDNPSTYSSRGKASALGGPSIGMLEDLATILTIPESLAKTGEIKEGQRTALRNAVPMGSFPGWKSIVNYGILPPGRD